MTAQEHEVIVRMFAKQLHYFDLVLRLLQSREVLEKGDLAAFLSLVNSDQERIASALRSVKGEYQQFAKEIGLTVTFAE